MKQFFNTLFALFALAPWALTLYLHLYFEQTGFWQVDTPYRGLWSVLLLGSGMLMSFWLYFRLQIWRKS